MPHDDAELLKQYGSPRNLRARMALHQRFSLNPEDFHRWLFERLSPPQDPSEESVQGVRVLELGCGDGSLWRKNAERLPPGWRVTLVDRSPGMLEAARAALGGLPLDFSFRCADAQDLPFEDASFEVVMAHHMLYHVPDAPRVLAEVRRVLVPGGRFYAATNGVTHMQELFDLIEPLGVVRPDIEGFSLEGGETLLRRIFRTVELITYPDALEVDELEPLLAYACSLTGAAPEAVLRATLERRLAQGSLRITKATGLFVAS